jgi:hypothetical protein
VERRTFLRVVSISAKKGFEALADASFARPFEITDGFIAALYVLLLALAIFHFHSSPARYIVCGTAVVAVLANPL